MEGKKKKSKLSWSLTKELIPTDGPLKNSKNEESKSLLG
jgi:hypothetical protein